MTLDGKMILINGELRYSFAIPQVVNVENLENATFEACQKYSLDYISTGNVKKWAIEIKKQFYLGKSKSNSDNGIEKLQKPREDQIVLTPETTREVTLLEVANILSTSIKHDNSAKTITFCGMLLAQTNNDQLNIAFQAESSAGKSYIPIELASYFPESEVKIIAGASPTAFFHDAGQWDKEKKVVIVDLEGKILIFLDMPHFQLLEKLRPLLSHVRKELIYKIADRTQKTGLRTKTVIVRGFPSVIFCTAKLNSDEQERTRLILLSPSTEQVKLEESLKLIAMKKGNPEEYRKLVQEDPNRLWLSNRIKAIRQSGVKEVFILDYEAVYNRFLHDHKDLQARHQRDFPRVIGLIKASALLNLFERKRQGDAIEASQVDIDAGFALYKEIEESNQLGLSPFVHNAWKNVIKPLVDSAGSDGDGNPKGVSRKEISKKYHAVSHRPITSDAMVDILEQLEGAGLIEQKPDPADRRSKLVYGN